MSGKVSVGWLLLCWFPVCFAVQVIDAPKPTARALSSGDMLHWGIGLLVVLGVFFLCAWGLRKLSGVTVGSAEKMRIVGGLSLGIREKVVLLQVGKKQLVLGVTPGRIDTLHVLEGDDCLNSAPPSQDIDTGFAHHLMQVMQGRSDG